MDCTESGQWGRRLTSDRRSAILTDCQRLAENGVLLEVQVVVDLMCSAAMTGSFPLSSTFWAVESIIESEIRLSTGVKSST